MKKVISVFASLCSIQAFAAEPIQSYKLTVELKEKGELRACPGFNGWQEETVQSKTECVFRYSSVVTPKQNTKLDFTGVYGYANSNGQIDIQYYVGDIDSGVRFQFKVPQLNNGFVFGDEPYKFNIHAGDYAQGMWDMSGTISIEKQ